MSLRSFFGFLPLRLEYFKEELPLEDFPLPEESILLIKRSDEEPEVLDLSAGDSLMSGQKILSDDGRVLSFSPVTGNVKGIYDLRWSNGEEFTAISIETSSKDEWDTSIQPTADFSNRKPDEVLALLDDAGFSLNIEGRDTVIINCLESDLLISNNQKILREQSDNIRRGLGLLRHIGAKRIILAITDNLKDAAEGIVTDDSESISIIKPIYPNGMAQMLSRIIANDESTIIGVEYLNAMVTALETGRPFIEKIITLIEKGGKPVKNIRARVGTLVSEIIKANNIQIEDNDRIILGGPMRGRAIYRNEFPVTPDTDAVFIQGSSEIVEISNTACLNCGECVRVCPYNLQVNLLARYCEFSLFENCEELDIDYCIECGLCAYVCSSGRPLVQYIQFAKKEIKKIKEIEEEEEEDREEVTA